VRELTEPTDLQILEFESRFHSHYGAKVAAIRDELDLTEAAYWQRVRTILAEPDWELAGEFGPMLSRLRRVLAAGVERGLQPTA
jgi:Protein of unknown function (DUF3263)